jgi:hypothetical protein
VTTAKPIVKQLDHIVVRVDDPVSLHALFSETLGLPVSWPVQAYPSFTSGGITLGNVNLEILSCGTGRKASQSNEARIRAIAFESESLQKTVAELQRRAIAHTPVLDYELTQPDGQRVAHWANVMLNGLIGDDPYLKFVLMSTRMPGYRWLGRQLRGSAIEKQGVDKLFSGALCFLVEYFYQHFAYDPGWSEYKSHDEKRAADLAALKERGGGALGVESMREVIAGVRDVARVCELWRKFLAPAEPIDSGVWRISDGPAVRLVAAKENAIQAMVWKVSSLARAAEFLRERGMLGTVSDDQLNLDREKIYGLDVRLTEVAK